uniref:Uncharacterized protein n=1 Tax=Xanthomonas vasicola pv. vasculorum NCPPB 890 TaxID=1184265 RepID=A0A836P0M6_XANVA
MHMQQRLLQYANAASFTCFRRRYAARRFALIVAYAFIAQAACILSIMCIATVPQRTHASAPLLQHIARTPLTQRHAR